MKRFLCILSVVAHCSTISPPLVLASGLWAVRDDAQHSISVYRAGEPQPILTQHARPDFRPYIHPLVAPDGKGLLTEYSPGHHKHQTGLYWGFTRVNGRDYFHHPDGDYWRRVSAEVLPIELIDDAGEDDSHHMVRWRTVYELLDEEGAAVLTETQTWSMRAEEGEYVLDLEWSGEAHADVTVGEHDYGGLFVRMPWREGIAGEVVNAARQRNGRAEGQRSMWVDVGMQVAGRDDLAHIAIFDHPENEGFPQPFRVDGQLGVGPVRARLGDWTIDKGDTVVIQHRLLVYTGQLNDVELTRKWSAFSDEGTYALWLLAREEGRQAEFLTPAEAARQMTLPEGYDVNVYAAEPMITQPMAFCWDDRGRLWIAENRDYEDRGRGFSNGGDSRILILEDTDRDGVADSRQVFSEGIPFPSALAVGFDGLWLGAPPNLLFLPDRDGDDRADADDIEVHLTGWGIRDRHETLNSFHWGPDGWLYGCQGFATPSHVGKPAGKGRLYEHREPFPKNIEFADQPVEIDGGVWRYHPTKHRFEVVAHGFSNPWGIDYDAKGQLFISACVIPHLWHVIPGGIYHRQGGTHLNPFFYSDLKTIADHRHRSAHGGARVYLSDAFPQPYPGRIFMANIHEHALLTDVLEPHGSGFIGRHGDDFLLANNAQWIGFSVEIGPAGGVYVLDWHDADICGNDVENKDTGRVFRIVPRNSLADNWPDRYQDLAALSNDRLVQLQLSRSAWHARRARLILQSRAAKVEVDEQTHASLREIYRENSNADWRLRALWALHVTGGLDEAALLAALDDRDPHIRGWAIQICCEDRSPSSAALDKFVTLALHDPSPVVRLYLAAALQRIEPDPAWSIASGLVRRSEDADDHNIPKMIWFGIEPLIATRTEQALQLAAESGIPLVSRHIARRLADADELVAVVTALGSLAAADDQVALQLLRGLLDALEGRSDVAAPENWETVAAQLQLSGQPEFRELILELAQRFGDTAAVQQMLIALSDSAVGVEERRRALHRLASRRTPELQAKLLDLLDDEHLRQEAIRAMASYQDRLFTTALLDRYADFTEAEKLDAIHTLASRRDGARQLMESIERGDVPRRDIPAYVARQLRRLIGNSFVDVWGPIEPLPAETEAQFAKYRDLLTDETLTVADPSGGRAVFQRVCSPCHKMYGEGGIVGPDITGANRTNLEYVLGNVLTPSAVIQDAYKMQMVFTHDGRLFSGILAGENDREIQLRLANADTPVVIAKSAIQDREIASVSMMPEGLLRNLSDREVAQLVAFLRTSQQVPLP